MSLTSRIFEMAKPVAGGAIGGLADAKVNLKPDNFLNKLGGPSAGVAAVGLGIALAGVGPRSVQDWAGALGQGAAAYTVGKITCEQLKSTGASATPGARVMGNGGSTGALPQGRGMSVADVQRNLAALGAR